MCSVIHLYVKERKAGGVSSSPDSLFLNYPFCMPMRFIDIPILEHLSTNAADMTYCLYADAFLLHAEQFNTHCRCQLCNNEEHSKPGQGLIVDPGFTLQHGSQPLCLHSQPTPSLFS
jgi:hypothetical protein